MRDPRTDPMPGDVLREGCDERTVLPGATGASEFYYRGWRLQRTSLHNWRRWARDAEVLHVAVEDGR